MRFRQVLPAALAMVGSAAAAQTSPPTPEARRAIAAKVQADIIIEQAHAEAWFENITDGPLPQVRHRPSGVECTFPAVPGLGRIRVFQSKAAPGDDIGCTVQEGGAVRSLYVTRAPPTPTLQAVLQSLTGAIRRRVPDIRPAPGRFGEGSIEGASLPPHQSVRLVGTEDGKAIFERASGSVVGDWVVTQRVTAPLAEAGNADNDAEIALLAAILKIQGGPAAVRGVQPP